MPPLCVPRYRRMTAWINRLMEDCAETLQTGTEAQQHQQKNNRITQPSGAATPRNSDAHKRIAVLQAFCVLLAYTRPRPKSGKVCRSDTRAGDVRERAERSEGSDTTPHPKHPCFAVCALVCDLSPRAECVPIFVCESERGPFVREVKNWDEKRLGTELRWHLRRRFLFCRW